MPTKSPGQRSGVCGGGDMGDREGAVAMAQPGRSRRPCTRPCRRGSAAAGADAGDAGNAEPSAVMGCAVLGSQVVWSGSWGASACRLSCFLQRKRPGALRTAPLRSGHRGPDRTEGTSAQHTEHAGRGISQEALAAPAAGACLPRGDGTLSFQKEQLGCLQQTLQETGHTSKNRRRDSGNLLWVKRHNEQGRTATMNRENTRTSCL